MRRQQPTGCIGKGIWTEVIENLQPAFETDNEHKATAHCHSRKPGKQSTSAVTNWLWWEHPSLRAMLLPVSLYTHIYIYATVRVVFSVGGPSRPPSIPQNREVIHLFLAARKYKLISNNS